MGALRSIVDRVFDRIAARKGMRPVLLALAVPAVVTGVLVTVHPGDSLSSIAQRQCGNAGDWSGIYQANKAVIGSNPDLILPGQHLKIQCSDPGWSAPVSSSVGATSPGSNENSPSLASTGYTVSTGFQQCVISRESGGNSQVMNSSGHYGLYQFSYDTWVAYGGSGADFGHASPAEQTQVFNNAIAAGGQSNWSPYDGC